MNAQVPIDRLKEFEGNGIIGQLNPVFWSLCGFVPNAARFAATGAPQLVERVLRYEVQAVLLVPASRLCHQTVSIAARAIESAGIPTMMLAVDRAAVEMARPPRAAWYPGEFGCVVGKPDWPEYQRRVLDEALRLVEPTDQPSVRNLVVALETEVEMARGERSKGCRVPGKNKLLLPGTRNPTPGTLLYPPNCSNTSSTCAKLKGLPMTMSAASPAPCERSASLP
jgi:D-proline reductase (dithiol) PrdB